MHLRFCCPVLYPDLYFDANVANRSPFSTLFTRFVGLCFLNLCILIKLTMFNILIGKVKDYVVIGYKIDLVNFCKLLQSTHVHF